MRITMLVPLILLVVAWYFAPHPLALVWPLSGSVCVLLGVALRLWAAGYLRKKQELVCWGPFSYLRNPLYLGTLLIGCGFALLSGRLESLALVALVTVAVYLPTIHHEERDLYDLFGAAYNTYCRAVPRLLPRLLPYQSDIPPGVRYRWSLVRYNQEHIHIAVQMVFFCSFYLIYFLKQQ